MTLPQHNLQPPQKGWRCAAHRHRSVRGWEGSIHLGAYGCTNMLQYFFNRRVSSVLEHSSTNPKVPGSILGPGSYRGHGLCFMHLTPRVVHNFPKAVGV